VADDERDPVEWTRGHWAEAGQPDPDLFAALAAVLRVHERAVSSLEVELKPLGLTLTGYLVLTTLLMSRDGTRPLGQLSKHLMIHPTTVTILVDQLEKRDLVRRSPHPSDRRITLARLTPAGRRLTTRANKAAAAGGYGLGPEVDAALARRLTTTLRSVRAGLGDPV
jgi:DNA-binding MarR family transcriptional regulator